MFIFFTLKETENVKYLGNIEKTVQAFIQCEVEDVNVLALIKRKVAKGRKVEDINSLGMHP